MRAAIVSTVQLPVAGSMSANAGMQPLQRIGITVPMSVSGVVMTSEPGSGLTAASATCSAAVPEVEATAFGQPYAFANAFSISETTVPERQFIAPETTT